MNLLALAGSTYEPTARGILYVIYEMMWKLIYYVLLLIDEVTKLFYKVAGINVEDGVVENKNMIDQLLNQNVLTGWYGIFIIVAGALVIVFSLVAIIKAMTSEDEKKSMGPILKNVALATLLLVTLGPIVVFFISLISNVGILIAGIGGDSSISIADIIFGNTGNLLEVYNATFTTEASSFRDLGNDFLYQLMYNPKDGVVALDFHWYIALLGGGFVLYNLICIVIEIVKRIFNIIILYVGSPFAISRMVMDDGKSFKELQSKFFYEFILLLAQMGTFMIFVALVNVLNNIDLEGIASSGTVDDSLLDSGILEPEPGVEPPAATVSTFSLLNGLGRTLIIMAAVSVTRTSATMFANLLSAKESKTDTLLESVLNKINSRSGQPVARTRTITKNTTTTKRETVFVESSPAGGNRAFANNNVNPAKSESVTNHNNINQTVHVENKFTSNNTFNNRVVKEGVQKGSYGGEKSAPSSIYINATRTVEPAKSGESFKYMDTATTKAATNVVKEYAKANNNLSSAIQSGDNTKLQQSLSEYTKAYAKEAEILSDNYRKFETKASASMKSEISNQTKQELKNITNAYRKAQMDYNKTATKLNQYAGERMSTADALKMKEQADKQRERLMSASNKAAQFYENQKKGE